VRRPCREAGIVVLLCALACVMLLDAVARAAPLRCNGHAYLCDVPVGDVAFATTHNSMSSSVDGFRGPNQGETIAQQLRRGIRGFQIDAYLGTPRKGRTYTDLAASGPIDTTDVSPDVLRAGRLLHQRLGAPPPGTPTTVYLCHTLCELGAITMASALRDFRAFLDRHPDDVVMIVIEDHVPSERLEAELDDAGLTDRVLTMQAGTPLPTLREMLGAGRQLVITLESGSLPPILPNAFDGLVEETPFTFLKTGDLRGASSCRANRGSPGAPIFQLNHWVTPASARRSRVVNRARLRRRLDECTDLRGRAPTLVAVDFAEHSDVVDVARWLNRRRYGPERSPGQ
jgi:hypothetical protein